MSIGKVEIFQGHALSPYEILTILSLTSPLTTLPDNHFLNML